ncbi:hypothetical protein Tco_0799314 [Tanacetum coccineum]
MDQLRKLRKEEMYGKLARIRMAGMTIRGLGLGMFLLLLSACPRLNIVQEPEGNRPNQVATNNGVQGRGNQGNQARGRAFMLGPEEDR